MGQRIIYKDGKEFACGFTQASKMVETEGWSWTNSASAEPSKKTTAKAKKAKIKAEAEVKADSFDDPDNHDYSETINIDLGTIEQSKENE